MLFLCERLEVVKRPSYLSTSLCNWKVAACCTFLQEVYWVPERQLCVLTLT